MTGVNTDMSRTRGHEAPIGGHSGQASVPGCEPLQVPVPLPEDLGPIYREIYQCVSCGNEVRTYALMSWLMRGVTSLPEEMYRLFISAFRSSVGDLARPIVSDTLITHRYILDWMIDHPDLLQNPALLHKAKNVAYRVHEACGNYQRARMELVDLINHAADANDRARCAHFTNNYGYDFLLEGDFGSALPHFRKALELYRGLNARLRMANVEANVLTCEFELSPSTEWESLLPRLRESHRIFRTTGDWRIRKTMRLLAMRAEARGRHSVAIAWARRAVARTRGMATRLNQDDKAFLHSLQNRRQPKNSPDRALPAGALRGTVSPGLDETNQRENT